jgi:hypothetical protein
MNNTLKLSSILTCNAGSDLRSRCTNAEFASFRRDKRQSKNVVWVLESKALPAWIKNLKPTVEPSDVSLATYHLSRYIRALRLMRRIVTA